MTTPEMSAANRPVVGVLADRRLMRNVLRPIDAVGAACANMAPAWSIYFPLAAIAAVAGLAAPLIVLCAAIGYFFHVYSAAEFSRAMPHAGGYIAYVGKAFKGATGSAMAFFFSVSFVVFGGGAITVSNGRWVDRMTMAWFHSHVGWLIPGIIIVGLATWLGIAGVRISTRIAVGMFLFETVVLVIAAVAMLVAHPGAISLASLNPANVLHGARGFALGFPLAVTMYIGLGAAVPLAEEVQSPKRALPVSLYASLILATVLYLFLSWATVIGFSNNVTALTKAIPAFLIAANKSVGWLDPLLLIAGLTSGFGLLVSTFNAHTRSFFGAARERMLPSTFARIGRRKTPWVVFVVTALVGIIVPLVITSFGVSPFTAYTYLTTLGGIYILVVYDSVSVAMPFYFWKYARREFSVLRHVVPAVIGVAITMLPLVPLVEPGQKAPFNYFPYIMLGLMACSVIYGVILVRLRPFVSEAAGSLVAETD